jgi:hypothetical protein
VGNDRKRIPRSLRSEKEFYSVRARARTKKKNSNESLDFNGRISSLFSRVIVGSPSRAMMMMMMMMKMMMMMWHPRKKLLKASFFLFF